MSPFSWIFEWEVAKFCFISLLQYFSQQSIIVCRITVTLIYVLGKYMPSKFSQVLFLASILPQQQRSSVLQVTHFFASYHLTIKYDAYFNFLYYASIPFWCFSLTCSLITCWTGNLPCRDSRIQTLIVSLLSPGTRKSWAQKLQR